MSTSSTPVRLLPEPSRFWLVYAPRRRRSAWSPWTDLAGTELAGYDRGKGEAGLPDLDISHIDDLLYLPPVEAPLRTQRDDLASSMLENGVPLLMQVRPGEETKAEGALRVVDLLEPLLREETPELVPGQADVAVWPLIPGLSDSPRLWQASLPGLAEAGLQAVVPLAVEISRAARRQLVESHGDELFDVLFHGEPVDEQSFAEVATSCGLSPIWFRPQTGFSARKQVNRQIAGDFAIAGDLWLRLDRPVNEGQRLLRAARSADGSNHDLAALVREDNLKVMDWLNETGRQMVTEVVAEGRSQLTLELIAEYTGAPAAPKANKAKKTKKGK